MKLRNGKYYIGFWITPEDLEQLEARMKEQGFQCRSEYLRVMGKKGHLTSALLTKYQTYIDPNDEWEQARKRKDLIKKEAQTKEHSIFMTNIITDPEFQKALDKQRRKILLLERPIPTAET